jgi:hypothetical protein
MGDEYRLTTEYKGIPGIYFRKLLNTIIDLGRLDRNNLTILDYGAGHGVLKNIIKDRNKMVNVINYDIEPDLTEIKDWRDVDFNIVVANEVFYTFDQIALESLMVELKKKNKNLEIIVGISKQSIINNIGKIILGEGGAHNSTVLNPKEEIAILLKHMEIIDHKSVWYLADIYRLRFN